VIESDPPRSLIFEKPIEGWEKYIRDNYITTYGSTVRINHLTAPHPQAVSLRCEETATIPNLTQYPEFLSYCPSATASLVTGAKDTVELSTSNPYNCLVEVAFGSDTVGSHILLVAGRPQQAKGVDRWRCTASGSECGPSLNFTLLPDDLVEGVRNSIVKSLGAPINDPGNYADLEENADPFGNLHRLSIASEVSALIGIALACVALVGVVIATTVWFVKRRSSQKNVKDVARTAEVQGSKEGGRAIAIP
jgi:hypothetical protein